MDWNELKISIHFNSFEQNMDWKNSIYLIAILCHGLKLYDPSNFFLDLKSRNHFVVIPRDRLKWINGLYIFFLIEKNKNRFVFIPSYGLKWILKSIVIIKLIINLILWFTILVHLKTVF